MENLDYILHTIALFATILLYFKVAKYYNIIDRPNHRSAHTKVTIRGGGIVFPLAFLLFYTSMAWGKFVRLPPAESVTGTEEYYMFGIGLLLLSAVSFMDDILDLSSRTRIIFHIVAVSFLLYFLNTFVLLPVWAIPGLYILIIGILNAYNFMDGINGMTGLYSLILLASLYYVNLNKTEFTTPDFIAYPALACLVFLFFNFRKKARCFMGDVGSMSIAFWMLAILGLLLFKTGDIKWFLFLSVYGVETVLTIVERLKMKENIFNAHRRHLYQLLVNEHKLDHRLVSILYAGLQLVINLLVIFWQGKSCILFPAVLFPLSVLYFWLKAVVKRKHRLKI